MIRAIYWCVAAVLLALLGLGFTGAWLEAGDSFAVIRGPVALVTLGWLAIGRCARWVGAMPILAVLAALIPVGWASVRPENTGSSPVTVYQKNMLYKIDGLDQLEADIRANAPDMLTLQEVTDGNRALLAALIDMLPYQHYCSGARVGGVAVASRWPVTPGSKTCAKGLAAMQVDAPDGPLWLASVHLHWPWPYGQRDQAARIMSDVAELAGLRVIGGDFNMVPWSYTLREFQRRTGTKRAGRSRPTFPEFALPIDHVLIPDGLGGATELRPLAGSDHRGLLVRFASGQAAARPDAARISRQSSRP
ncbi:endonuclease/exonuclease/phosphatase family protein [Actibacterium sp. 188UL27-1]|uniref:endonuclease/exonuclease/phosphatase family protein n=1 Tax=Actibacterium sp. 188UL27-1 TaxID=2786961 RepID=UPI001EF5A277|nr:endonuclease/exonuclease/phosphatase family protein [Actibacterium sp. 188UL27-1]